MPKKISVLVVDDSAFVIKALRRILSTDPMIEVVADARDGLEALKKMKQYKPDVVTLDVMMAGMNGLQVLSKIMQDCPTPVIMVSSITNEGGKTTLHALEMGAVDFVDKSSGPMDLLNLSEILIQKIKVVAKVDLEKIHQSKPVEIKKQSTPPTSSAVIDKNPSHIVAIGTSTGGPISLEKILTTLPRNYPGAILVVQHMPVGFTKSLATRLNQISNINIKEAENGGLILPGNVYIAKSGLHLNIKFANERYYTTLTNHPETSLHRPSVDEMMKSVGTVWPGRMLGIIMTGMGDDGSEGIQYIKNKGGTIVAQSEETCVVFGMPKAAQMTGNVDKMVPLNYLAREIIKFS